MLEEYSPHVGLIWISTEDNEREEVSVDVN